MESCAKLLAKVLVSSGIQINNQEGYRVLRSGSLSSSSRWSWHSLSLVLLGSQASVSIDGTRIASHNILHNGGLAGLVRIKSIRLPCERWFGWMKSNRLVRERKFDDDAVTYNIIEGKLFLWAPSSNFCFNAQ